MYLYGVNNFYTHDPTLWMTISLSSVVSSTNLEIERKEYD